MSQFNPTIRIVHGDDGPDLLAGAVLNGLTRTIYRPLSLGIVRAFALTVFTLGLLPLLLMSRWLRIFISVQEQQLWHLAEWMRLQSGDADAVELQRSSRRIRFNLPLALLAGLFLLIAVAAVMMHFTFRAFSFNQLFRFAYHVPASSVGVIFTFALSAAAFCHWVHLAWHQQNVEGYLRWFNQLAARQGLDEIALPKLELGLSPLWILAGIALSLSGALWALPVMLACGAHRRYIRAGSVQVRALLAERLRAMLVRRRPTMRVPRPITVIRSCVRPNCRAAIPSVASFCPRCGTRATRAMDVVA